MDSNNLKPVIQAPEWLKQQRRELRAQPPPSIEKVRACFEASANYMQTRDEILRFKKGDVLR